MAVIGKYVYFVSASVGTTEPRTLPNSMNTGQGAQPYLIAEAILPEPCTVPRQTAGNV